MDEYEAEHLRQRNRELEQSRGRWRAVAIFSLVLLGLFMVAGAGTILTAGTLMARQAREARMMEMMARDAEMRARQQAEEAERAAQDPRRKPEDPQAAKDGPPK
jgi:hypothetical protein